MQLEVEVETDPAWHALCWQQHETLAKKGSTAETFVFLPATGGNRRNSLRPFLSARAASMGLCPQQLLTEVGHKAQAAAFLD